MPAYILEQKPLKNGFKVLKAFIHQGSYVGQKIFQASELEVFGNAAEHRKATHFGSALREGRRDI